MLKMKFPTLIAICLAVFCLSFTAPKPGGGTDPGKDAVPANYFIPDSFFTKFDLDLKAGDNPYMRVWSNPDKKSRFSTVNDIRLRFASKHKAQKFFKDNLKQNSENAEEIHPGISIPGTQELHIYKESDKLAMENKKLGYSLRCYFFLYLVDNVYVKVFVAGNMDVTAQDASAFAMQASNMVHQAMQKK